MKVAVLGTGMVGRSLAGRLSELGHEVAVGTREVTATLARTGPDAHGTAPYGVWAQDHPDVTLANFTEVATSAELVVNATSGDVSMSTLNAVGETTLAGKILLDISNPLDFSEGFPPKLFVKDTDSLGERIQAAFPQLKVVKALNTLTASLMVNPAALADGDHSVFVCGNDSEAKQTVVELLASFGHTDIIDLGDITNARGTEMYLGIWTRLMAALGTSMFNVKVVR